MHDGAAAFRLMALRFCLRDILHSPAKLLREAGVRPGMTVFDFGCGPGGFSIAAAGLVGPSGRVLAYDINPLALRSVGRAAAVRRMQNVVTVDSPGFSRVSEGSVDAVLLYDVMHDIREPAAVLAAIHRILKPDGFLSTSDHHLGEKELIETVLRTELFRLAGRSRKSLEFARRPPDPARSILERQQDG